MSLSYTAEMTSVILLFLVAQTMMIIIMCCISEKKEAFLISLCYPVSGTILALCVLLRAEFTAQRHENFCDHVILSLLFTYAIGVQHGCYLLGWHFFLLVGSEAKIISLLFSKFFY